MDKQRVRLDALSRPRVVEDLIADGIGIIRSPDGPPVEIVIAHDGSDDALQEATALAVMIKTLATKRSPLSGSVDTNAKHPGNSDEFDYFERCPNAFFIVCAVLTVCFAVGVGLVILSRAGIVPVDWRLPIETACAALLLTLFFLSSVAAFPHPGWAIIAYILLVAMLYSVVRANYHP